MLTFPLTVPVINQFPEFSHLAELISSFYSTFRVCIINFQLKFTNIIQEFSSMTTKKCYLGLAQRNFGNFENFGSIENVLWTGIVNFLSFSIVSSAENIFKRDGFDSNLSILTSLFFYNELFNFYLILAAEADSRQQIIYENEANLL